MRVNGSRSFVQSRLLVLEEEIDEAPIVGRQTASMFIPKYIPVCLAKVGLICELYSELCLRAP